MMINFLSTNIRGTSTALWTSIQYAIIYKTVKESYILHVYNQKRNSYIKYVNFSELMYEVFLSMLETEIRYEPVFELMLCLVTGSFSK